MPARFASRSRKRWVLVLPSLAIVAACLTAQAGETDSLSPASTATLASDAGAAASSDCMHTGMAGTPPASRTTNGIPLLQGRVTDTAGMLSVMCKADLTRRLKDLEQRNGTQLALLIVSSMAPQTIEQFATAVFEKWKLGQKRVDNGVLLVAAVEDHRVRIEVGYGLEGTIPDVVAGQIIRDRIVPAFRQGAFEAGLSEAVGDLLQRLGPTSPDTSVSSESSAAEGPSAQDNTQAVTDTPEASAPFVSPASAKPARTIGPVFWILIVLLNLALGVIAEWRKIGWKVLVTGTYAASSVLLIALLPEGTLDTGDATVLLSVLLPAMVGVLPGVLGIGLFRSATVRKYTAIAGGALGALIALGHAMGFSMGDVITAVGLVLLGMLFIASKINDFFWTPDGSRSSSSSDSDTSWSSTSGSSSSNESSSSSDSFSGGGGSSGGGGASDSW